MCQVDWPTCRRQLKYTQYVLTGITQWETELEQWCRAILCCNIIPSVTGKQSAFDYCSMHSNIFFENSYNFSKGRILMFSAIGCFMSLVRCVPCVRASSAGDSSSLVTPITWRQNDGGRRINYLLCETRSCSYFVWSKVGGSRL